jgi:hypothetical protein
LDKEDILVPNNFIHHDVDFAVFEVSGGGFTQRNLEDVGDLLGEGGMGRASEDAKRMGHNGYFSRKSRFAGTEMEKFLKAHR